MADAYTKIVLTVIAAGLLAIAGELIELTNQGNTAPTIGNFQAAVAAGDKDAHAKLRSNIPISIVYVQGGGVNTYPQGTEGLPGLPGLPGVD